jgi:hypothetical protein
MPSAVRHSGLVGVVGWLVRTVSPLTHLIGRTLCGG